MVGASTAQHAHVALTNANFPLDGQGNTYHVACKPGEIANRIITVGDPARAILIARYLDGGDVIDPARHKEFLNFRSNTLFIRTSSRLFTTVTGRYQGVPVSIIAIGMGVPMMDFFVREVRAVVTGPLHIIRFGSCGSLGRARAGDMVVASESVACSRNFDYFVDDVDAELTPTEFAAVMDSGKGPYTVSRACGADAELTAAVVAALKKHVPAPVAVHTGLDITADSFYSSQARQDTHFRDQNAHLFAYLKQALPAAECLQMETFGLLHLARSARPLPLPDAPVDAEAESAEATAAVSAPRQTTPSIRTAACAMVFAHRVENTWIDPALTDVLQDRCARAILDALIAVPIAHAFEHPETGSVWARN